MMSERLIGRKFSATEVSQTSKELTRAVEAWREQDLSGETRKYIFVDDTLFSMRINGAIEKVPVLAAIGITDAGHRTALGLQLGDKESASSWHEFSKDLKRRRLSAE